MTGSPSGADQSTHLLLVEDNPGDARLVAEALGDDEAGRTLHTVSTGSEALDFVHQRGDYADAPRPDLVLLDWNLPGTSGEAILAELRDDPPLEHVPVVVLTGSQAEADVVAAYANHANACLTKAGDPETYMNTIRVFEEFWLSAAELPEADE